MNEALIRIEDKDISKLKDLNNININLFFNMSNVVSNIEADLSTNISTITNITYKFNTDNLIESNKQINMEFVKSIQPFNDIIEKELLDYFKPKIIIGSIEELVLFSFIELHILLFLLENKSVTVLEFSNLLQPITYINMIDKIKIQSLIDNNNSKWKNGTSKVKNTNLLVKNKYAYELPADYSKLRNISLKNSIHRLNLPLIEIPGDKEDENLLSFLDNFAINLESLKLKHNNFSLRIRKLGKTNKNGLFIVNANTIIIDPRYPEVIYHELGHFIYENKLSFTLKDKRYYYSNFNKYIAKFKKNNNIDFNNKHNMEKYSNQSELFAYWFEKLYNINH